MNYQEEENKWVKENNVHILTKVRVKMPSMSIEEMFRTGWNNGWCVEMTDKAVKGFEGVVTGFSDNNCGIQVSEQCTDPDCTQKRNGFWYPYFALEVVHEEDKEPVILEKKDIPRAEYVLREFRWLCEENFINEGLNGTSFRVDFTKVNLGDNRGWNGTWTPKHFEHSSVVALKSLGCKNQVDGSGILLDNGLYYPYYCLVNMSVHYDELQKKFWEDSEAHRKELLFVTKNHIRRGDKVLVDVSKLDISDRRRRHVECKFGRMTGRLVVADDFTKYHPDGIMMNCNIRYPVELLSVESKEEEKPSYDQIEKFLELNGLKDSFEKFLQETA